MGSAVLVKDEREAGWDLLDELRRAEFPMDGAFWEYLPDADAWRLFIVTPIVDARGPIAGYTLLQTHLEQMRAGMDGFSVANISLIGPRSERVAQLRKRYGTVDYHRERVRRIDLSI